MRARRWISGVWLAGGLVEQEMEGRMWRGVLETGCCVMMVLNSSPERMGDCKHDA